MKGKSLLFWSLVILIACNNPIDTPEIIVDPGSHDDTTHIVPDPRMGITPTHQPDTVISIDTIIVKTELDLLREQLVRNYQGMVIHERWYLISPMDGTQAVEFDTMFVEYTPQIDTCVLFNYADYRVSNLHQIYNPYVSFCFNPTNDSLTHSYFQGWQVWKFSWNVQEKKIWSWHRKQAPVTGPPYWTLWETWTHILNG
jgi:hypothetical protein